MRAGRAETHWEENIGATELRPLVVKPKEPATKMAAAATKK